MPITSVSSREFNQELGRSKKSAEKGPVFITDRGRPTHVLLHIDEYRKITNTEQSLADLLSNRAAADIEFDPPRLALTPRPVHFD